MNPTTKARRAIGIVRVSQTNGRSGDSFVSPSEQRDRIKAACERDGLTLVETFEELDVSGGSALEDRPGLRQAVAAIEAGRADVVAAAYFDRLFRSLSTQAEVLGRVEHAGGQVLAVDVGQVTNGSAGQWLSGTMLGAVSEYHRRSAKERSAEAQARAVERGVALCHTHYGYLRGDDRILVPDPETAPNVVAAFELRASGGTMREVWEMLRGRG
ncbi:MAG: recombinase family protein, partial [Actinomycetota bacterium]|nr:recombinase family protein [Actinomycetota bacterium]